MTVEEISSVTAHEIGNNVILKSEDRRNPVLFFTQNFCRFMLNPSYMYFGWAEIRFF